MTGPDDGRPLEEAVDPATAHGLSLAALIGVNIERKRDQTAATFGITGIDSPGERAVGAEPDPEEGPDGDD